MADAEIPGPKTFHQTAKFREAIQRRKANVASMDAQIAASQANRKPGFRPANPFIQNLHLRRAQELEVIADLENGLEELEARAAQVVDLSWKEIEALFRKLQREMSPGNRWRTVSDTKSNLPGGVEYRLPGSPTQSLTAVRHRTEWKDGPVSDDWLFFGGTEEIKHRFTTLAGAAARKLGFFAQLEPEDFWLEQIQSWREKSFREHEYQSGSETDNGRKAVTFAFEIKDVAEKSADMCLRLIARGTPERVVHASNSGSNGEPQLAMKGKGSENNARFTASDDFRVVKCGAIKYNLIDSAAQITRALYEAHLKGKDGLSGSELRKKVRFRNFSDQFRSQDGPAFYKACIERLGRNFYKLSFKGCGEST